MSTHQMSAISQRSYGGPEVLTLVSTRRPVPGPDEVLVRVRAAGVNPADWRIRSGSVRRFGDPPFTLGLDLAGTVESVGGEVFHFRPGDKVYGVTFPPRGSYAEYVAVKADRLALAPRNLDLVHAAALPVASLTAWQPLTRIAGLRPGQRVLIHAAGGGVGHLAIQLAKSRGAEVTGTARPGKHDLLRRLGADELIDYTSTDFVTVARDLDLVLDPISGDYALRSLQTLKPGGLLIDVRGSGPDRTAVRQAARAHGLRYVEFGFEPSGADLADLARLVESEALTVVVEHVFAAEDAAEAHELSETGAVAGKIVLTW